MKTASVVLACALIAPPWAHAADPAPPAGTKPVPATKAAKPARPAKEGGFGSARGGPLLSRDELRACFAQQERIRARGDEAARGRAALDAEKDEIVKSGAALKAELETLDRGSQDAVDLYNARAAARDQRIDAYEAATAAYNAKVEALKTERDGFARACDNRRYDEADEIAIKSGR